MHSQQENLFREDVTTILSFVQLSLFGDIDPDITFEFLPIYELTEKEKAELRATEATTGKTLIEVGALDAKEERTRVAHDPETPYAGLDIDKMPDLKQEEEQGLMPGGHEPPAPEGATGAKEEANDGGDEQVELIRKLFGNGMSESQVDLIRKLFGNGAEATAETEALQDTIRRLFGNEGPDETKIAIQKLFGSKSQASDIAMDQALTARERTALSRLDALEAKAEAGDISRGEKGLLTTARRVRAQFP